MKYVVRLLVLLAICSSATAQFVPERLWVGPTIGLSGLGFSIGVGAQAEYAINENFGVGLDLSYSSFKEDGSGLGLPPGTPFPVFKYTLFAALASGSYHFMPNKNFDPYVKLGLGYLNWDVKYEVDGKETDPLAGVSAAYTSGLGFTGQVGARYHFSDGLSARASIGYPLILALGLDLAVGGTSAVRTGGSTEAGVPAEVKLDSSKKKGRENEYSLWVGPYLMGKVSIKSEVAEGWKTGVVFNVPPDFGVSILAPFGKHTNIGFGLDFGLANYGYQFRPENDPRDSVTIIARYSYVNMFPHLNLGGFIVGLNFGFVNGASTRTVLDSAATVVGTFEVVKRLNNPDTIAFTNGTPESTGPLAYMASMVEVRVGGAIPVVTSDFGRLDVLIQAGYSLSGLFTDYRNYEGSYPINAKDPDFPRQRSLQPQESLNPHMISLSLGLCYRFRLGF